MGLNRFMAACLLADGRASAAVAISAAVLAEQYRGGHHDQVVDDEGHLWIADAVGGGWCAGRGRRRRSTGERRSM